jgi:FtsP/CotA-like multicopper oxidase with cupredoxin domain
MPPTTSAGAVALLLLAPWSGLPAGIGARPGTPAHEPAPIRINDNRRAAGTLRAGVLTLRLEARVGTWHPDGDDAPGADVPAFAEAGDAAEIPGPLIRVPAGTEVAVTVRNLVPNATLTVHGLHTRSVPAAPADSFDLAPGAIREVRFRLDAPGTYYYWATTMRRRLSLRTREDAQLSGAIVVDEPNRPAPDDRILVIGLWSDTVGGAVPDQDRDLLVVNGRSWPHTERLSYTVGDTVRWRVLNATADPHPMHLHGFFFRVESRGDGNGDTTYVGDARDVEVTERMIPGQTAVMSWVPVRAGHWLFHCHIPAHFAARGRLGTKRSDAPAHTHPWSNHALEGMNGLVLGIIVQPRPGAAREPVGADGARRTLRLLVRENAGGTADRPYYGFALQDAPSEPPPDSGPHPGPPIVLTRGEPVSIWVVNRTPEPTAVHWHGIELESYYDGVAGFSGSDDRVTPLIAPDDSFEARFTPPRAGTFIYHTHVDELRQQPAGLAGPLIVQEPGSRYDPAADLTVLITSPADPDARARAVLLNGSLTPTPLTLRAGTPVRVRFINMTTTRPLLRMELRSDSALVGWRVIAKDGAEIPEARRTRKPARQPVSIGETVDVELVPAAPGDQWLEARTVQGQLLGVLAVRVHAGAP